jgi:hypothetical protein
LVATVLDFTSDDWSDFYFFLDFSLSLFFSLSKDLPPNVKSCF